MARMAELLQPFSGASLPSRQLEQLAGYLESLLRWNARINLTGVRGAEDIVTRHFGESLFLAGLLFPAAAAAIQPPPHVLDLGSGAGFPGLPLKIHSPDMKLTLVESNFKKATFLREVIRALQLQEADVFPDRAERLNHAPPHAVVAWPPDVITMRAVERFEDAAQTAAKLVRPGGTLAVLVGGAQAATLTQAAGRPGPLVRIQWAEPVRVPQAKQRVIMLGKNLEREEPGK
jgi:16S rRNA (guanine527-N7)-methyltransferase